MERDNPYQAPDTAAQSAPSLPDDRHRPRRLTIAYVFAWVVLTAIIITIDIASQPRVASQPRRYDWVAVIVKTIMCLSAAIVAAGILGTVAIFRDKLRGMAGRLQPGHWLLIILSMAGLARTSMSLERLLLFGPRKIIMPGTGVSYDPIGVADYLPLTVELAMAVGFLVMAIRLREGWPWRLLATAFMIMITAVLLGQLALLQSLSDPLRPGQDWSRFLFCVFRHLAIVILPLLLAIVLVDIKRHEYRDGLHWLGVVFAGYVCVSTLIWELALPLVIAWS